MADLDNDRTVVVERETRDVSDTRDSSSPLGWIILLVLLLLALMFFLTDGFGLLGDNTSDANQIEVPVTNEIQEDATAPSVQDSQNDTQSDPLTSPDATTEPAPDTTN